MADDLQTRQDGPVLHFLKGLPDRYLLLVALVLMAIMYAIYQVDALLQVVINVVIAIIALSQKKPDPPQNVDNSVTADTIKTPIVKTDTMPDATVNLNKPEDLDVADQGGNGDEPLSNLENLSPESLDKPSGRKK